MNDESLLPEGLPGVGPRIKAARDRFARIDGRRRFTQSELADVLGVSTALVGHWETGHQRPDIEMLERLARALKVSVAWIYPGEGPIKPAHTTETDEEFTARTGIQPRAKQPLELLKGKKKPAKPSRKTSGG